MSAPPGALLVLALTQAGTKNAPQAALSNGFSRDEQEGTISNKQKGKNPRSN